MNDAELYHSSNTLQKRDTIWCLDEHTWKMKWKNYNKIIDIGCGDGSVTSDILKSYLPGNFKKLIGCDISERMVKFANEHYSDERTAFRVLNIESSLPNELQGAFDHAFSFYALHWIKDQTMAFSNIYRLLTENGNCLLMFLGYSPIYDVFRMLSKSSKWHPWLKEVELFVSPYHDCQEPENKIREMMEKIGFKNISVKSKKMSFVYYSIEAVKKSVAAVNPFKIPKEMYDEFNEDYLKIVKEMSLMDKINNNDVIVTANYNLLVVCGSK